MGRCDRWPGLPLESSALPSAAPGVSINKNGQCRWEYFRLTPGLDVCLCNIGEDMP